MTDDQKSIVIDVQMKNSEKWYTLQVDKISRRCTDSCRVAALRDGIGKGDEVLYTINTRDLFSYLKPTGQHFDLKELPQPATAPIIDAEKAQERPAWPVDQSVVVPKTDWQKKFELEQRKGEIIMWEALLNTAKEIVVFSGGPAEDEPEDIRDRVEKEAERLHAFIMEKVGEGK